MIRITRGRVALAIAAFALLFAFGVWVLLHPASIWVQPWRAQVSATENNIIFGPYPTEEDFPVLKDKGVTTIISLLNPVVPYEKVLLEQERERAARFGIEVQNFPMGSILGQKFGADYQRNEHAAARAALASKGTAYIHCYLGINRAKNVQRHLRTLSAESENYAGVGGSVGDVDAQQRAIAAYKAGRYAQVLQELDGMQARNVQALRIEAWSAFRLGDLERARIGFERIVAELPEDGDARTGLGYVALRADDLPRAETLFVAALERSPEDLAAMEGMGHVRFRQTRPAEAVELFERVLAADPANDDARMALARARAAQRPTAAPPARAQG